MPKKIFSFFLAVILVISSSNISGIQLNAKELGNAELEPLLVEPDVEISMYGDNGNGAIDLALSNGACFDYGTKIQLSLSDTSYDTVFRIKSGEEEDKIYSSDKLYEPGEYRLGYICDTEDDSEVEDTSFENYGFTIVATKLGVPSNLKWDGTKAVWDTLKTDINGNELKGNCNYVVTLYRDGEPVTTKEVIGIIAETQTFDFAEYICSGAGGKGKYTFCVKAVAPESLSTYYTDSEDSGECQKELYAVEVSLDKKEGIASAMVTATEETTFLLIAGAEGYNSKLISAVATDGWSFGKWSVDGWNDSDGSISFDSATAADAMVTITSDYSGATEICMIANPYESVPPVISEYTIGSGENEGKLVATAYDSQSGLKAYAFSTSASPESIGENEWTVLSSSTVEAKTVTFTPTAGGNYYFYAKDADDNICQSSGAVPVTAITYEGYYENNAKISKTDYYIGSGTYTLPDLQDTAEAVCRKGYKFEGWYTANGTKVTSLSDNPATNVTYSAKWTVTELAWATELAEGTFSYTGNTITLTAKINDTTADVQYIWYKKNTDTDTFVKIETNTTGKLGIRNVSDSGEYRVDAEITYTDDLDQVQKKTLSGTPVTITITPAFLTVQADDISITYGDEAPTYTFSYEGLLGEDITDQSKALITEGSLSCTYTQGDSCKDGGYTIGFATDFTSENYSIIMKNGTLTVKPKNVNAADTSVTVILDDSVSYTYTGNPVIPVITVWDGDTEVADSNYTIGYDNNVSAGTHTATITFRKNYTGSVEKKFTISKNGDYTPVVEIADWDYGDEANSPSISSTIPYENPKITYYYLEGEQTEISQGTGMATRPVDAGTYTVYAIVKDPQGNYGDRVSAPVVFTIHPKTIYLIAGSRSWEYDGNPHSYDSYTIQDKNGSVITEDEVFERKTESFQSIKVTGVVTDVTLDENGDNVGVKNIVSYTLTSVTNSDNYEIQCVDGVLKVTPTKLLSPANLQWDSGNPGTATWVAISKSNLVVKYEVRLYMHDAEHPDADQLITTKTTAETSVDFANDIHGQISADSQKSFYFTVKTLVSGSTDTEQKVKNDYMDSEESEHSDSIYTATVYLSKKLCDDEISEQEGLESVEFTGRYAGSQAVTLIAGESVSVQATAKTGYVFTGYSWCSQTYSHEYDTVWHPTNPDYVDYVSSQYQGNGAAVITISSGLTQSLTSVNMTASVEDRIPTYRNFTAVNKADYSGVTLSMEVMDELGIKRWRLEQVEEVIHENEDGSTYTYYNTVRTYDWNSLQNADGTYPVGIYVPISVNITEPGTYRIQFSDADSGESRVYVPSKAYTVYEIKFDKGDADDTEHTMNPVYKLANTEITLPACVFTKTGSSFQNWSGTTTGISVDQAVFKANANDTLVACWTTNQYTYKVEYYYMNTDGTYSETPSETAEFTGKYGDVIVASTDGTDTATESIQKPKRNYSNDAAPVGIENYQNTMTLTGDDQVLRIYYKSGNYTITYKYTVPGEMSETRVEIAYNYGSAIIEPEKPEKTGYDFVGWVYEGYGSAPATMPAKDLVATGTFVAKPANYMVVYHLENLGNGTNHTGMYTVNDSLTQSYNSKQGEQIRAYLNKGAALDVNEIEGMNIDGFTLAGVNVSYGNTPGSESGMITENGIYAEGTVQYDSAETLYIHYYYTRNEYKLNLEVWKDSREVSSNKIYSHEEIFQYGEDISALTESYKEDSYYIYEDGTSRLEGFAMPEGYKFTSYTDYSTGKAPTVMPAGNVTVTRDVVPADRVKYYIEVYFEKTAIGSYDRMTRLTYEAVAGSKIKIVDNDAPQTDDSYTYIRYDDFIKTLNNYNYYTHISIDGSSVEEGTVTADTENPLVLKVYFERITTTATISYIYGNSATGGTRTLTSFTVEGKWGSSYTFDPTTLFDANTDSDWLTQYSEELGNTVTSSAIVANVVDANSSENDGLAYDFRNNNYLVSYQCYYDYFNSNDVRSETWPSYTFTTVSDNPSTYEIGYKTSNSMSAGLGDYITCYFGIQNARCTVAYNQIKLDEDFYLDVRLDYQTRINDKNLGWYHGTEANGNSTATSTYDGTTSYIPITYPYDANNNGSIESDEYYQLRIMNKCAIVNGTPVDADEGAVNYPAANAKTRKYTYESGDSLKPGFTHITGEYYFFDPTVSGANSDLGNNPCVFLADSSDRFMQGAYVGYTLNSGKGYDQVTAFLEAYKTAHGDTLAEGAAQDDNAQGLYVYNKSYGSTYVYGTHGYLTYNFYYHDKCQLTFYYNGQTCSNSEHLYVYGTRVSKDMITCSHIATEPTGYELVWYTDSSFTTPIPDEGLVMNVPRTVYGRMEKKTVPNMEYIYYELADAIKVDDTTYNYVTQDNIEAIRATGKTIAETTVAKQISIDNGLGGTVQKLCNITTYTYEDAVVMVAIERPTVSFTELYLAKDTDAYSDYSGDYEDAYGKTGFYYDETNTDNRSYGYVNTTPIYLKVYFARDKYQVEVITNVSAESNPEYYTFSIDHKVQLEEPVREGYTFAGWSWKKVTASGLEDYMPVMEEGKPYFKMPAAQLQATANWIPAEFSQKVTHYFQTAGQVYRSDFISGITGTPSQIIANVTFQGMTGSADIYKEDDRITAVVFTANNGDQYYFSGGTVDVESVMLQEADLVAAVTNITVESEKADTSASQDAITSLSMYSYAYTLYQSGATVQSLGADSLYTPVYGMTLEYYYTRSANCTVRLFGVATDGGESGLSFNGAGDHIFGESVNIVAVLSEGYEFLGWYKAEDVFTDYPNEADLDQPLSEYTVKSNLADALSGVTPISVGSTYQLSVTQNLDLVAVVKADDVVAPDLVINGKTNYTYGYETSASNSLMAIVTKSELAAKTTILGYQWYQIEATLDESGNSVAVVGAQPQLMEGQISSTLLIPTGLDAGAYLYRCVVSYKNNDNGRTEEIQKDQGIVVNKANMTVEAKNYTGVFDNQEHSITLTVSKPISPSAYTIYYSSEQELTAETCEMEGTTTLPTYIHVNSNESGACAHTTYFYIKDTTGNYNDYTGSATVDIQSRMISIKTLNATFSKMYDGDTSVGGSSIEQDTDMYNFAHGNGTYYELSGFVDGDSAVSSYILACSAEFNDYHVTTAKSFTVKDLKLVNNATGITEYDYSFPATTSLTFAGMITPRPLNVEWEDKDRFVYNGTSQAPTVKLSDTQTNAIPEGDKNYIELTVTGKQVNVGSYTAYASAGAKDGGRFFSSDYTFDTLSKEYQIVPREIRVVPVDETIIYNGNACTINAYKIYCGDREDTVVSSYTTTAVPVVSHTDAGTYTDMQFENLVISDATGKVLTDNYTITYDTGTLTINPAPVTVTGITAEPKEYDGTTSVVIHIADENGNSTLNFTPLYSQGILQDELNLDISKITAAYDSSAAGTTQVNLTIPAEALTGRSAGNYVLDTEHSQKTAVGNIGQSVIKIKAEAVNTVYGENAEFTYTYSGIIREDGTARVWSDITVSGTVSYEINTGTKENPVWEAYVPGTTPADTYEIKVDVSGLSTDNYTFEWEEDVASILTVKKRQVSLNAVTDATITKTYDGTTAVNTAPEKNIHYTFGRITGENENEVNVSGVLPADAGTVDLSSMSYVYDTKDVTASTVVLTNAVINNDNYELINTECNIPGKIEPVDLTIQAEAKTITYGTVNPEYEADFIGFVTVDGITETAETVLSGSLTFNNAVYNATDSNNRHEGTYANDIIPGGYGAEGDINGNYKIHYQSADLTVDPKTVYLTAVDQELRYKVGNDEDGDGNTGEIPSYTYTRPEWAYPEDAARYNFSGVTLPRTETGLAGGTVITLLTVPGTYPIKITTNADKTVAGITKTDAENDTHEDYIFKAVDGTLTVKKYTLTITGTLTLADKYYDGTDKIVQAPTEAAIKALFYDGVAVEDQPHIGIDTDALLSGSQYASKDVGESVTVALNIELNEYLDQRYELDTTRTNVTATSSILARPIEVQAGDKAITYGDPVPNDYGIVAVSVSDPMTATNMGLVSGEALTEEYGFSGPTGYICDYNASAGSYSPVDINPYPVKPTGVTAGNYAVTCVDGGKLTVTQATLATPVPVWDNEHPGTVTWTAVSGIGDVAVAGYKVELYKAGVEPAVQTIELTTELTYDFANDIRTNGGGQYKVKVTAIASNVNNEDNKNVKNSVGGMTAKALYATKITPVFVESEGTIQSGIGAQVDDKDPIYINHVGSYVVIAGESNIPIQGILQNDTGYTVAATADSGLTLGEGSISTNASVASYNTTVSVAADAVPSSETQVTLTLTAREATLVATFTADKQEVTYGFSEGEAPKFEATVQPKDDNIGSDGYTYTYEWKFMPSSSDVYTTMQSGEGNTYRFPYRYGSYNNTPYGTNYRVKCVVTATRNDNGKSVTYEAVSALDNQSKYIKIKVKRGSYEPVITFASGEESWIYGAGRHLPYVTGTVGEVEEDDIHFLYSKDGITWRSNMYTDVGTYYAKAHIDETANYDAVDTNVISYSVTQAKLDTPTGLDMTASDTAPYGKIVWNAVSAPQENAGTIGATDSNITVNYRLTLAYIPTGGNTRQQIGEPVVTSETWYDFTDRITEAGTYYVTVQAIVDEQRNGQDALNCADSNLASANAFITIGATVSSNVEDGSFSKVYDGEPLTLTVSYSDGSTPSYQWMKNGEEISGANDSSISITYVEESASFVCKVTTGNREVIYSRAVSASITPRPITITTATDTKTYDGSALTKQTYTITSALGLATGDVITAKTMSASQTDFGSAANTISGIEITRKPDSTNKIVYSENASNVVNNYSITVVEGRLSISKRAITIKAQDAGKTYNGTPLTSTAYTITSGSLVAGDRIDESALSFGGSITDVGEVQNMPSGAGIKNDNGEVTGNYAVTYEAGTLAVTPRPLQITAGSNSKTYDGTSLTDNAYEITGGTSLVSGDEVVSVTVTGTRTDYGVSSNVASEAVIKRGETDISGNYDIDYVAGTLTVQQRAVTIMAENQSSCYSETPVALTCSITNPADAGVMTEERIKSELNISLSCPVTNTTPVGDEYPITVNYDTTNQNYAVTTVDGFYRVTPAEIHLSVQNTTVEYDKTAHSLTFTATSPASDGVTRYYSTVDLSEEEWEREIEKLKNGQVSTQISMDAPFYTNKGTYTIYCYGTKDNYTAGKASGTLTITPKPINSADITVAGLSNETYNGSAFTPTLSIRYGDRILVQGTDYQVEYVDNIHAGDATVKITGIGNYKEFRLTTFTIQPRPVSLTWTEPSDMTYDGQEKTVSAAINNKVGNDQVWIASYTDETKTKADTYTAVAETLGGSDASDYTLIGASNVSYVYTIVKRNLDIETLGDSKVYDGTPLTKHEYRLANGTTTANGESLSVTFTGTQTDADSSENTISNITVLRGTEDVTENYSVSVIEGTLTVTPKPLADGDITVNQSVWEYTGDTIQPEYTVSKELLAGHPAVTLEEGTDYRVIQDRAITVGTHKILVEGQGNYSGISSVSYSIVDNTKADISGIIDDGKYCISATMEITDPNLVEVVITRDDTEEIASFHSFTNGRLNYTLDGSEGNADGSIYTIYVKDLISRDADNIETYHEQTYHITVYPSHKYDFTQNQYVWDSSMLTGTQSCQHLGDAEDTIINRWGTVVWNYAYVYDTPTGEQSGTQGVEARATYAKVELLQNGRVIATQYVNCDSQCGVGSPAADSGVATYKFTTYDPVNPESAGGTVNIPQRDEDGREYTYSLNFAVGKMDDGDFIPVSDYEHLDSVDYSSPYSSCGYQRSYTYSPEIFDVPWEITLTNLPKDAAGNLIYPSALYVKVLFAMSANADDSETETGYQIISQQAGNEDLGVPCTATVNGNTVVYSGSYPVWKYIGGTTASYYHRIQVVGYEIDGNYVDVSSGELKSINDTDHINHTIFYVNDTNTASGIVQYELSALLPSLVFDSNDGSETAHAVINSVINGTVSYDDIQSVQTPTRSGYIFKGWYTDPIGGTCVTSDVDVATLGVTLYAHWEKEEVPPQEPDNGTEEETEASTEENTETEGSTEEETEGSTETVAETSTEVAKEGSTEAATGIEDATMVSTEEKPSVSEDDFVEPEDSSTVKAEGNHLSDGNENGSCRWHYIIFFVTIIYALAILLTLKRKKEEENFDADEWKKRKRNSIICRGICQSLLLIIYIWVNIHGFCWLELPSAIVGMLLISLEQLLTYRHKFKKPEDTKESSN